MPYLDGLEFRPLPDTETRYASIENGDVDLIFGGYQTELLRGLQNPNLTVYYGSGHGAEYVYFNQQKAPFDDHRMREAVVRGIDLNALAATQFRGQMEQAERLLRRRQPVPDARGRRRVARRSTSRRPRRWSQEYVAEGGSATVEYKTTNAPNRVAFAEFLQAQMAAIGITLQPQFFDLAQYSSSVVQSQDFQIAGWVGGPVDAPYPAAQNLLRTGGNANYGSYSNPKVDALLDQAAATTDDAERTAALPAGAAAHQPGHRGGATTAAGYLSTIAKPEVKGVVRYLTRDMFFATTWLDR